MDIQKIEEFREARHLPFITNTTTPVITISSTSTPENKEWERNNLRELVSVLYKYNIRGLFKAGTDKSFESSLDVLPFWFGKSMFLLDELSKLGRTIFADSKPSSFKESFEIDQKFKAYLKKKNKNGS